MQNLFDNAIDIISKMRNGEISLADAKNNQAKFKSNLGEIKKTQRNRSKEQETYLHNTEMLYKARSDDIKFYDDYSSMISEAKLRATKGTGLKILTPKQILQRLLTAHAQVKAWNNLESLLNKIRKTVYSLHQSKEITKKLYNNY